MQVGRDRRVACLDPYGSPLYNFGEIPRLPRGNRRTCLRSSPCGWRRHVQFSDYRHVKTSTVSIPRQDFLFPLPVALACYQYCERGIIARLANAKCGVHRRFYSAGGTNLCSSRETDPKPYCACVKAEG